RLRARPCGACPRRCTPGNGSPASGARDAQDLIERRHALADPAHAVLAQPHHSRAQRVLAQLALGGGVVDAVAKLVVGGHELVDARTALVAGEIAGAATHRAIGAQVVLLEWRLALGAELA